MLDQTRIYVGGRWVESSSSDSIPVVNPATDEILGEAPAGSRADVAAAVAAATGALPSWKATPLTERLALLGALRDAIAQHADDLALLITREMGTPIAFSRAAQLGLPLGTFARTIAAAGERQEDHTAQSRIVSEAVGVVAAITPWNFPLHQIAAKIVPALAAGCAVVLKPSEMTPFDAAALAELIDASGFPAGVFNLVFGAATTGIALVEHDGVDMVSFTGSTAAGRDIAARAGAGLKKVALELGGKSANLLLDDVALDQVIPQAIGQCFVNAGQTCAALTRLIVPDAWTSRVEEWAVTAAATWQPSDPEDQTTRMGPLVSRRQLDKVRAMVGRAQAAGARTLIGGTSREGLPPRGAYFAPTVLSDVAPASEICREEVFGPVLVILGYADEEEAIRLANDSDYGLSGGVWSADRQRAETVARRLKTGHVSLNGAFLDLEAPFGGVGHSGFGRELGRYGLEEYLSVKTITGIAG